MKQLTLLICIVLLGSSLMSGCSSSPKDYDEEDYQDALNYIGIDKTPKEIKQMIKNHEQNR